ncbi:MAG: hypothetical protein IJM59_02530 [Proteobacteria bacterium]|nr:hypothetical protein [Pseudomonadota bacterium]
MRKSSLFLGCALAAGLSSSALMPEAQAQEFSYKGFILSDLRLSIPGQDMPKEVDSVRFNRMDNTVKFTGSFAWDSVDVVADLSLVYSGKSEVNELTTLQQRSKVDPFYFESDALYIRISDFIFTGLDLKLGRQIIDWGSADRFNPTSVVNGLDLEDYQDFGHRIANEMVNVVFAPDWEVEGEETPIFSEFQFQVVWVPRFRSNMVPESSEYVFGGPDQFRRFAKSQILSNLVDLQELYVKYGGSILYDVKVGEPSDAIQNSQVGVRLGFSLFGVDLDFYGYYGYDHNMQPRTVNVNAVSTDAAVSDAVDANIHLVAGNKEQRGYLMDLMESFGYDGISTLTAYTDVTVEYPRIWMAGMDFATSLDFMGGVGLWGELAFTIHDDVKIDLDINGTPLHENQVDKGFFVKAVVGIDNSFTKWLYMNMQYIYGFVDEFGANDLEHYLMWNGDFKAFNEQMLFRLSLVWCISDPSAMLVPSFSFKFWPNTELAVGALIHVGKDETTFGNRVTGPNYIYLQAKYNF